MKTILTNIFLLIISSCIVSAQPESVGKIWKLGDVVYQVRPYEGVLAYDITNPTTTKFIGFVRIPGVVDIAMQNEGILFANEYDDLVCLTVDFSSGSLDEKARNENVFPSLEKKREQAASEQPPLAVLNRRQFISSKSISGYGYGGLAPAPLLFAQGSMSRLASRSNHLYAVNNDELMTFDATVELDKNLLNKLDNTTTQSEGTIETIFLNGETLYLGTTLGMKSFDISMNPSKPKYLDKVSHAESCDPVFVKDNMAYITTRKGSNCNRGKNLLMIADATNPADLKIIKEYSFSGFQFNPHGLAVTKDKYIMIADGRNGIKIVDARNPKKAEIRVQDNGFFAYDVILDENKNLAIVSTDQGLRLYDISNINNPKLLDTLREPDTIR
jgi:hypothetical protein